MENTSRNVLVAGLQAVAANVVCAAGDDWDAAFATGPKFANEAQFERSGLILSTTPRSSALFPGAIGTTLGSSVLGVGRFQTEGLAFEHPGSSPENHGPVAGVMASQYFHFRSSSPLKPTIGGGLGLASTPRTTPRSLGLSGAQEQHPVFMFRFEAGLGYEFSESVRGGVSYRLLGAGQSDLVDTLTVPFSSEWERDQAVEIGVHIDF